MLHGVHSALACAGNLEFVHLDLSTSKLPEENLKIAMESKFTAIPVKHLASDKAAAFFKWWKEVVVPNYLPKFPAHPKAAFNTYAVEDPYLSWLRKAYSHVVSRFTISWDMTTVILIPRS
jgi:hypothetical protein